MNKNNKFTIERFSWREVAKEVSRLAGKTYSPSYIREVATGYRANNQLKDLLNDLGVLQIKAA